jgi:hypothetical protein
MILDSTRWASATSISIGTVGDDRGKGRLERGVTAGEEMDRVDSMGVIC